MTILAPLAAHHSFAAEFDDTKPVKMTGVVTKVEWTNPHIWFYVDVKDATARSPIGGLRAARPASSCGAAIAGINEVGGIRSW